MLIELRRLLSLLLIPWIGILLVCLIVSWYTLFVLGLDALLAPIIKFWLLAKSLILKTLPAVLLWLWIHTGGKLVGWATELIVLASALLGGWKAWSAKKLLRQAGRFLLSISARFVAVSVLFNLLFGHERRGIKSLPRFAILKLHRTAIGRLMRWWSNCSERQKRLLLGIVLCLILILAGQAMLGVSVLLFDLIWELVLLIWRVLLRLWRLIGPWLLKLVPNVIGNFFTQTILPLVADLVPVVKDDHRVFYIRFNIRRHIRRFKAWLYLKSRARRQSVRRRITPLISQKIRERKAALLSAAVKTPLDRGSKTPAEAAPKPANKPPNNPKPP